MPDLLENVSDVARESATRAPAVLILAALCGMIVWVGVGLVRDGDRVEATLRAEKADLVVQLIRCHELHQASGQSVTKP